MIGSGNVYIPIFQSSLAENVGVSPHPLLIGRCLPAASDVAADGGLLPPADALHNFATLFSVDFKFAFPINCSETDFLHNLMF